MSEVPRLLCVHPHPDDESIACGGVLARYSSLGAMTTVITATGGEAGENLAGIDLGDEDLTAHRRRELADALDVLGVSEHVWLGYRDSGMADTPANDHPEAFVNVEVQDAARSLATHLRRLRPHVVVSDDEHGSYGHPDHIHAHKVTVAAVELAADERVDLDGWAPWRVAKHYVHALAVERLIALHASLREAGLASPFSEDPLLDAEALPFGAPEAAISARIDVRAHLAQKRAALQAHRSQIADESFFLNVPEELAGEVFGVEEFIFEGGVRSDDDGVETDLFAGLAVTWPPQRAR